MLERVDLQLLPTRPLQGSKLSIMDYLNAIEVSFFGLKDQNVLGKVAEEVGIEEENISHYVSACNFCNNSLSILEVSGLEIK